MIAAYFYVRLITRDSRALNLKLFALPSEWWPSKGSSDSASCVNSAFSTWFGLEYHDHSNGVNF